MSSLKRKRDKDDSGITNHNATRSVPLPADSAPDGPLNVTDILSRLKCLLDLSSLTEHADLSVRFMDIAEILLNGVLLRLTANSATTDFEILELEFYLFKSGCHEDPFTHGTEEQRQSGKWYFHRAPRRTNSESTSAVRVATAAGGYRGGTRKGLDLTFGGPVSSASTGETTSRYFPGAPSQDAAPPAQRALRGGILLRTLRNRETSKMFSGPSLLVDELLRLSNAANIAQLVKTMWIEDINAFPPLAVSAEPVTSLRLCARDALEKPVRKVYRSPRIGLDLSNPGIPPPAGSDIHATLAHPRTFFISKRYRYFVGPTLLTSNGRGHTLLGVYEDLVQNGDLSEDKLIVRLESTTGLKLATIVKYLGEYRAGGTSSLRSFIGAQGKGSGSSPVTFLRMLGCLDAVQK
ncbi:uncharacterized protein PHACADRAFT_206334 [Phanerochaete carnosa HHB-10118-sp]|uniref:Uncharacterized protein n=1 Tax=Phanerochaete carnosa (strain HHB-10118-sp) TaxID=650164 RepID=K5WL50_PHACS|nr:uncharacterized protein PHACADRAFT_206334 [Phanerochaete carnosa HHB-10118-sp]EKM60155.1 hypothetical protein PHACADRAFT_206334 [Phanerochaete carnosa HHB-10118-sp]